MEVTIWEKGEELKPGKLVLFKGYYFVLHDIEEDEYILKHPFKKNIGVKTSLEHISVPFIIPWAEEFLLFMQRGESKQEE